jgi:hypothetical protein
MLRREPTIELLASQLRARLCTHCRWRPAGSEGLPADTARSCEPDCSVFLHLPALARTAHSTDRMLRPPELTLRHRILELCRNDPDLARPGTGCPLRQYHRRIARIVADAFGP